MNKKKILFSIKKYAWIILFFKDIADFMPKKIISEKIHRLFPGFDHAPLSLFLAVTPGPSKLFYLFDFVLDFAQDIFLFKSLNLSGYFKTIKFISPLIALTFLYAIISLFERKRTVK